MPSAFISYASTNLPWARWVAAELQAVNISVKLDRSNWSLGEAITENIDSELTQVDMVLALLDREYFAPSRWTRDELSAAATLARQGKVALLPIRIGSVELSPYYDRLLRLDLYDKPESVARRALREELAKITGQDLTRHALPETRIFYPGSLSMRGQELIRSPETTTLIHEAALDSRRFLQQFAVSTTGENIDAYMDQTMMLGLSYSRQPPQAILQAAQELRKSVIEDLEKTTAPGSALDLHLILGKLLGILSYATMDLGEIASSLDHVNAAIFCGRRARHDDLEAWGLGTRAMILRFQGRLDRSLEAVNVGLELKVRGSARARLLAQAALDWSEKKDTPNTVGCLREADDLVDQPSASGSDMADGIFLFPRAKYHYYAGAGYMALKPKYAILAAQQSRAAIERFRSGGPDEQSYSDELLACLHLARANLKAEELDAIPMSLAPLLSAEPQYRTAWHVQFFDRLVTALRNDTRYRTSQLTQELSVAAEDFARGYITAGNDKEPEEQGDPEDSMG